MSQVYVYSDPHFGHEAIIKYESRPFMNAEHMSLQLVNNWNKVVRKEDKVFVLGDFSFLPKDMTKMIVENLNGHKTLILGNHDRGRSVKWWQDAGFNVVSEYPIIVDNAFIMSHEPMYLNDYMPYVNIHGHMHGKTMGDNQYVNVSVEQIGYKPILFSEIKERYASEGVQAEC